MDDTIIKWLGYGIRQTPSTMNDDEATVRRRLYLSAVLALFRDGLDTAQIARVLNDREYNIERALHEALLLDRRKG